ncbi:DNA adenine methylase [Amycolatopsis thermophila]|uniref:DNA adenine methylase n=1 Tax=Amycolatopsis thermophila TaxID=206084 RepID=A0ABU0EMS6_9PSEU|nr:DNA adenine methylase [Amycolatopsis thermophila]MDQ0376594.1 DNA adenine methylase [Amycolatopsis thermophila]
MSRPPFTYFGGKTRLADRIVAAFPPHEHYVEPFAGSLAVLLAKAPSRMETVNDLDRELMTFWRVLRDQPAELARVCALTPHSRAEHLEAYDRPDTLDDLERARRVWVCLTQGRAGVLRKTGWRHHVNPSGHSFGMPGYLEAYVERILDAAERISRVSLECRPALDVIADYGSHPGVLLYVDPPYLGSARVWGNNYRHELRGETEHRELAEALLSCKASVVLSGYDSSLYAELYDGWHVTRMDATTSQGGANSARTEVLWSNRLPEPDLFGAIA